MEWLNITISQYSNARNEYPLDFKLYESVLAQVNDKTPTYNKIKGIMESRNVNIFSAEEWQVLNNAWMNLQNIMANWLYQLDSKLPDDFRMIVAWLSKAEKILQDDNIPAVMNEETASLISKKLEDHKEFFAAYDEIVKKFNGLKTSKSSDGISAKQFDNIQQRLLQVELGAKQRRIKLKFLEHKCCLIAFLNLLENKINGVKYGREETVKQSLDSLRNFMTKNKITQEFEKALVDMKQVIEEYKMDGNISKKEIYDIDIFLHNVEDKWKSVSSRLKYTDTMLEDILKQWQNWNTSVYDLQNWLQEAENSSNMPEDDKMKFFQNVHLWRDKYDKIGDVYQFLKGTCDNDTALYLDNTYNALTMKWKTVYQLALQYTLAGDIKKNRKKCTSEIDTLTNWLNNAEDILSRQQFSTSNQIRKYQQELKAIENEIDSVEDLFKAISKRFQSLIKDMSRDDVDKLMTTIKKEKERLVCVRAQIPLKLHFFHQLLIQQESLENGQKEINDWLDEAENLLSSYTPSNDIEHAQNQLEKHKTYFAKTLYFKSMLESKNKVFENLLKAIDIEKSMDVSEGRTRMKQINERFRYVTDNASQWEHKLLECVRCWQNFNENRVLVENFVKQSELLMSQYPIETQLEIETQKQFFNSFNPKLNVALKQSTDDLIKCLPQTDNNGVLNVFNNLDNKWNSIVAFIPLYRLKLDYLLNEIAFNSSINEVEKEINFEEQALNKNEKLEVLLKRNDNYFGNNRVIENIEGVLQNMSRIIVTFKQKNSEDKYLFNEYEMANRKWQNISKRLEALKKVLQNIPLQWEQYNQKFLEMTNWMDVVDNSLKAILTEMATLEEFENEKMAFQVNIS